ncbi:MAG: ATP-NAD kinase family protein [Gammaproteobacteria bacterium]|nr:ATP-NAD kinase family protein [Gammaproteobacteria bacterium]
MDACKRAFRLGLIVNPRAGLGGRVALKGSDGLEMADKALALGAKPMAGQRTLQALNIIHSFREQIVIVTVANPMGAEQARQFGSDVCVLDTAISAGVTSAADTQRAARAICAEHVDLLLFAGGDGTARDIYRAVGLGQPVLGIPAGVKMQSGVFANTPDAAGELVKQMIRGEMLSLSDAQVRDIDEEAYRNGKVLSRYFGELRVPEDLRYLQHVKCGGVETEALVLDDIAAGIVDTLEEDCLYFIGAGSTTMAVKHAMGVQGTLLGVDLVKDGVLLEADLSERAILDGLASLEGEKVKLLVTLIGGQGHLFGRGNQQFSPEVIRRIGRDNILVVASKEKLKTLEGRPIQVDTGEPSLDRELAGYIRIMTGYDEHVIYPINGLAH